MKILSVSTKGILAVDSNLLLLLVVGAWNPWFIAKHRRLCDYTVRDFELVRDFVSSFRNVATTAHVLAEVSNLAGAATGEAKTAIFRHLAKTLVTLDERVIASHSASILPEFIQFGLTDAGLSLLCIDMPLLTEDKRLSDYLQRRGREVFTLESLRTLRNQANHG